MSFAVGSLVKARGREWVVLPESEGDLLMLRPLGGTDEEQAGILSSLEKVEPAQFNLPDPTQLGDHISCRLLRDAVRLGFRSSAGPFRSFAKINVEPRPYQLVPLIMGLKLNPVRILISDDVGIGKTVEACLIARELLDRNEVKSLCVLCPPHLAEQWQRELRDKFHIEAELVLPSTVNRLEKDCNGESLFKVYPFTIVSLDYIKTERNRHEFLRTCPELVIVDEAHTCAFGFEGRGGRHQRHELLKELSRTEGRNLILVSAVPHSGNEQAFRSLLSLLNPSFANLPLDLTGPENEHHRRRLAAQFIQRRRKDIEDYLGADTPFPERLEPKPDFTYKLSPDYKEFFDRVLKFISERVQESSLSEFKQRVQWWSALALLRCLGSSPAAAAATLRSRASVSEAENEQSADEIGRQTVMDISIEDSAEAIDVTPGTQTENAVEDEQAGTRRRLLELAKIADSLRGEKDEKLKKLFTIVKSLLKEGFSPIVFCRFIETADYIAEALRQQVSKGIAVESVTGMLPPADREQRVTELGKAEQRILVCTDCLSEGINLQDHFNAVLHYDLSWNPTRHEQREGRVDRYGQSSKQVKVITYYGADNRIDGIVLDVLLRKHKTIRNALGISVPVPVDSNLVMQAIMEGLLLRRRGGGDDRQLQFDIQFYKPEQDKLHTEWENVAEREKRSRTMFKQESIKVEEVQRELDAVRAAIGSGVDVARFVKQALESHQATFSGQSPARIDFKETPRALNELLRQASQAEEEIKARFELPIRDDELYLCRSHPVVEALSTYIMDSAFDSQVTESVAKRCGVIRTSTVNSRTTCLLLRLRFDIVTASGNDEQTLLAEDSLIAAFTGSPSSASWLDADTANSLLQLAPDNNIAPDIARQHLRSILQDIAPIRPHLDDLARNRGQELLDSHQRVRVLRGVRHRVEPKLPVDILGLYVFLP
jgi:superfamily II DNA or RNA helicase